MSHVFLPRTLDSLWDILAAEPGALVYAGGTDLLVRLRQDRVPSPPLVCLEQIEALTGVEERGEEVFLGACSTHASLLANPLLQRNFPVLTKALQTLGSPPIRNMGTVGGNLCTASPAGDALPPLYLLDARLDLCSRHASRRVALSAFIRGPGQTDLRAGEIVSGIWVHKAPEYNRHHFEKVGQRKALAIAVVSLAAMLRVSPAGLIEKARLAWGSVGPTVVTSPPVEAALIGRPLSRETLQEAAALAREAVSPIDDVRASATYRRAVAGNLLGRLLGP